MNIFKASADLFNFWDGAMVAHKPVTMTIKTVRIERIDGQRGIEERPVLYFEESAKGMVLGAKTNVKTLALAFGAETDNWAGQRVTLFAEHGRWFGQESYALRIAPSDPQTAVRPGRNGAAQPAANYDIAAANADLFGDAAAGEEEE